MAKSGHLCVLFDTPTPKLRSACLGVELCLGGGPLRLSKHEARISTFFGPPRRTCESCFCSSISLILTSIHWINKDSNK